MATETNDGLSMRSVARTDGRPNGIRPIEDEQASLASESPALKELHLSRALMRDDWSGLRILHEAAEVSSGLSVTELAARLGQSVDAVASTVSLLVQGGALEVDAERFACTAKGRSILEWVDAITAEPAGAA